MNNDSIGMYEWKLSEAFDEFQGPGAGAPLALNDFVEDLFEFDKRRDFCERVLGSNRLLQTFDMAHLKIDEPDVKEWRAMGELYEILSRARKLYGLQGARAWWNDWSYQKPIILFTFGHCDRLLNDLNKNSSLMARVKRYRAGRVLRRTAAKQDCAW